MTAGIAGPLTTFGETAAHPGERQFTCAVCGVDFWRYPARNRGKHFVACSRTCVREAANWFRAKAAYEAVSDMSDTERAWLAAAIDGEGCLSYVKTYPRIQVANTCLPFLERCVEITSVGVIEERKKAQPHWKRSFMWKLEGYAALAVLEQIVDLLIVKQDKAITAIATRMESVARCEALLQESVR
jgi:hypothetical protein